MLANTNNEIMTLLKYTFATFLIIAFTSCENNASNEKKPTEQAGVITNPHEILLLNNQKWKIAPEMMSIIQVFATDIQEFNGGTEEDYKALSKRLTKKLNELTSNCTMKGQAHDELHKWLLPFLDLSRSFAKDTELSQMESSVKTLKEEIVVFSEFFE